jgi:hypothetical protein
MTESEYDVIDARLKAEYLAIKCEGNLAKMEAKIKEISLFYDQWFNQGLNYENII